MIAPNSPRGGSIREFDSVQNSREHSSLLQYYFEETGAHPLLQELVTNKEGRVLDMGCGLGSGMMQGLLYYGFPAANIHYLDLDSRNLVVDRFERRNKVLGSALSLPFRSNSFDMVYSNDMTLDNHELNYRQVVREVSRVLTPGGVYIADEGFDHVREMRTQGAIPPGPDFGDVVDDVKLCRRFGLQPVMRERIAPQLPDTVGVLYFLRKEV